MLRIARFPPAAWLLLTTVAVVLAFGGATLFESHIARSINADAEDIAGNADPAIRHLAAARTQLHAMTDLLTTSVMDGQPVESFLPRFTEYEHRFHEELDAYAALPFFPTERDRWQHVDLAVRDAGSQMNAVVLELEAGDRRGAAELRAGPAGRAIQRADVGLENLIAFNANHASRLGRSIANTGDRAHRLAYILDALAAVMALVMLSVGVKATRAHVKALRQARDAEGAMTERLQAVAAAAVAISENVGRTERLDSVLQTAVDAARSVAGADFEALGVGGGPSRAFEPFVYAGVDREVAETLGPPLPKGILSAVMRENRTICVDDVTKDSRFSALPPHHPPIGPFLGVPVRREAEAVGQLYIGRTPRAEPFTDQDARAIELLAAFAATAIQNARLYAEIRREVHAREDLLSIVSHDLRNPLSAMSMATGLLATSLAADSPARKHVELLARNAARMNRLIDDLLTAARVHAGQLSIEPRAQSVAPLVTTAIEEFSTVAAKAGIDLHADVAENLPPVYCDGDRILQVLSNLIGNALKFTSRGGSVVVSARASPPAQAISFSVRDTGTGIPEDALSHVFDRYWQKRGDAPRGTGLGLFITKGIVESHRGQVRVTSRVGEGSTFEFDLPAADWPTDIHAGESPPALRN